MPGAPHSADGLPSAIVHFSLSPCTSLALSFSLTFPRALSLTVLIFHRHAHTYANCFAISQCVCVCVCCEYGTCVREPPPLDRTAPWGSRKGPPLNTTSTHLPGFEEYFPSKSLHTASGVGEAVCLQRGSDIKVNDSTTMTSGTTAFSFLQTWNFGALQVTSYRKCLSSRVKGALMICFR